MITYEIGCSHISSPTHGVIQYLSWKMCLPELSVFPCLRMSSQHIPVRENRLRIPVLILTSLSQTPKMILTTLRL